MVLGGLELGGMKSRFMGAKLEMSEGKGEKWVRANGKWVGASLEVGEVKVKVLSCLVLSYLVTSVISTGGRRCFDINLNLEVNKNITHSGSECVSFETIMNNFKNGTLWLGVCKS